MRVERLDDYQSWAIHADGTTIVIDPWLVGECTLPGGPRIFRRTHRESPARTPAQMGSVDAIFLTAHFGDHFHEPTLAAFSLDTPVYSTKWGGKRAEKMGFRNVHVMGAGEHWTCGKLNVTSIAPAFPYAHNSLGFLFESANARRVLLETHGVDRESIPGACKHIDVLITAIEGVRLLGIPFTLGLEKLLEVVTDLSPTYLLPTGTRPEMSEGIISKLLSVKGTVEEFEQMLRGAGATTRMDLLPSGGILELNS